MHKCLLCCSKLGQSGRESMRWLLGLKLGEITDIIVL